MCDPISVGIGLVGGMVASKALAPKSAPAAAAAVPTTSPAEDQAKAEGEAAQKANAQLAADNRRRREQQSLMLKGAPAPATNFGDSTTADGISPLGGIARGGMNRSVVAQRTASLMSAGAAAPATGGAPRSGGSSNYKLQMMEP